MVSSIGVANSLTLLPTITELNVAKLSSVKIVPYSVRYVMISSWTNKISVVWCEVSFVTCTWYFTDLNLFLENESIICSEVEVVSV